LRLGVRGRAIRSCWATWTASNPAGPGSSAADPALPSIAPWALDQKNVLRVPTGITHVVLDTPGGIHGFELARDRDVCRRDCHAGVPFGV
jgi:hypothetical protein